MGRLRKPPTGKCPLGPWLREFARRPGWSEEKISKLLRVKLSTIYRWQAGGYVAGWVAIQDFLERQDAAEVLTLTPVQVEQLVQLVRLGEQAAETLAGLHQPAGPALTWETSAHAPSAEGGT